MEIKINKEIRAYRETLFFGLSVRQFVCSVLAVGAAVLLKKHQCFFTSRFIASS